MSLSKLSIRSLLVAAFAMLLGSVGQAQFKASIQGTVMDPNGAAVAGAKVSVTNQDTGVGHDTVTSPEGFYRVS